MQTDEDIPQLRAKLDAAEIEQIRASSWAMSLAAQNSRLIAALKEFTAGVTLAPLSKAQRIVGYKDKLDALVTEALIPMSDPPTVEATREWRDSQKTAIQPEVEDVKIEHSTRVITRRQETIRL